MVGSVPDPNFSLHSGPLFHMKNIVDHSVWGVVGKVSTPPTIYTKNNFFSVHPTKVFGQKPLFHRKWKNLFTAISQKCTRTFFWVIPQMIGLEERFRMRLILKKFSGAILSYCQNCNHFRSKPLFWLQLIEMRRKNFFFWLFRLARETAHLMASKTKIIAPPIRHHLHRKSDRRIS